MINDPDECETLLTQGNLTARLTHDEHVIMERAGRESTSRFRPSTPLTAAPPMAPSAPGSLWDWLRSAPGGNGSLGMEFLSEQHPTTLAAVGSL